MEDAQKHGLPETQRLPTKVAYHPKVMSVGGTDLDLGVSRSLALGGIVVLAVGLLIGVLGNNMLANERTNWWNAQMDLTRDQAMNDQVKISDDQYNIHLAENNIWEAQGQMAAGSLFMLLGVGIIGAGIAFKK